MLCNSSYLRVLILNINIQLWTIKQIIRKIFTTLLSTRNREVSIIPSAQINTVIFCLSNRDFVLTYSDKYFLYIHVLRNQQSIFFEPLAKQYRNSSKNGVVGNIGRIMPTIPNVIVTAPTKTKSNFFIVFKLAYKFTKSFNRLRVIVRKKATFSHIQFGNYIHILFM